MIVGEFVIVAAGILVAAVARGTATGRIGRNHFAGIRTKRSMADDESWTIVHRGAQPWMIAGGALIVLSGAIAAAVPAEPASAIVIGAGVVIALACTLAGVLAGHRALSERAR
ncbi:SdpI family protein [Actinomadura sp. WMMB 499]|uniref:SdpI family protein n=1 Tax=Actinomadura sp. WMMB 499 TaxID=1219491 RepID=UPI001245C2A1|nr:SdpI family protein [Actinomadura sp. WMMB 499]QFG26883.1 SdpI family protein [Actinomadura sp. WMMB 499]